MEKVKKNKKNTMNNEKIETSTKNVILGCFLTAFLSIPLSIFGTKEYEKISQSQDQSQNQNTIVNINKDFLLESQEIEELNAKILKLESENEELRNKESLNDGKIDSEYVKKISDCKLFIDGNEKIIDNSFYLIKYGEYTYLREDIFKIISEEITYENNNRTNVNYRDYLNIDIKQSSIIVEFDGKISYDLLNVYEPSEKPASFSTTPFVMKDKLYSNGFSVSCNEYQDLLFVFDNAYSTLEFDFGHIDKSGDGMFIAEIYIDNKHIKTLTKNFQDNVSHEIIKLNGGRKLKIRVTSTKEFGSNSKYAEYGFANAILTQYK